MTQYGMIAPELRALRQWCVWKTIERDGKPTKPPFDPRNGYPARTHDQEGKVYANRPEDTWVSFEEAATACRKVKAWLGVGFIFSPDDPYVGIDIDDCVIRGNPSEEAKRIVKLLNSYTEKSPSGAGIHIILRGKLPPGGRRKGDVEMYEQGRYFTFTGDCYPSHSIIEDRQAELNELHESIFGPAPVYAVAQAKLIDTDSDLIEKARHAENGGKFTALYDCGVVGGYDNDDSRADLALCSMLAFWTGPDEDRINRLFRGSALYRKKWDRADYAKRTIQKTLEGAREYYDPHRNETIILNGYKPPQGRKLTEKTEDETDSEDSIDTEHTERRSADRVIGKHGENIRHAYEQNCWYVWNGNRWAANAEGRTLALIERELREAYGEVSSVEDKIARNRKIKALLKTESARFMRGVLSMMRSRPECMVDQSEFDADNYLLNCTNGTLNLLSGTLRPHKQEDMITKLAGCGYDQEATCPIWNRFIERILPDPAVRSFMQRACGYSLTGVTTEQCFFFLFGAGANGKTVFISTILEILGEYGQQAFSDMLLAKSDHKEMAIAQLVGKRFVATIEIDQGRRMAEGLVKQMTGSDRLRGKLLYQNAFEFQPTHKIFMAANHRPVIQGTDHAIWRRVMLVPFTETIPDHEQDPDLTNKLKEDLPGILQWCVEGCLDWQRTENGRQVGLRAPSAVLAATKEYRAEQDTVGRFLEECCHTSDDQASVRASTLYECYRAWCETTSEREITNTAFGRELTERGYAAVRGHAGNDRRGICLNDYGQEITMTKTGMFRR